MVSPETRSKYTATIGIECHVQLKTATKLFDAVGNDAREAEPNTLVGPLSFGLPGTLPVLNKEAVHLAMRAAYALGTVPQKFSTFDRKHYFYPDLPLGYQITQFEHPIVLGGFVDVDVNGEPKRIGITRAHIEADAGKSTHPAGKDYSLVDLNRAGTPLLEIVSEPDMHTAAEVKAYAHELYLRMRFADVSDCNLYYGNMRFDVNVSVSTTSELGTRSESKNLNSFRSVEKAVEYEVGRQIELLEKGEKIVQETRGWDDAKQRTFSQRSKEDAHDYRYFPDPDIPPIELSDDHIATVAAEMSVMPDVWRTRLVTLGIDKPSMESLLEAELDDPAVNYLALIEEVIEDKEFAKILANWFVNLEVPLRRDDTQTPNAALTNQGRLHMYRTVNDLVKANKLSSTNAKALMAKILTGTDQIQDVEAFAKQHNMIQESDSGAIDAIVKKVIEENPKAAEDVRGGEMKAIGFLVGQIMKQSQGRANPGLAQELIKKQLGL
ncbi:MAG TPA: Asp-tRNA(Asn)/Glu-tRNA(Gln) amidotransferase subunit GatB [Candidatus Saccharimonadales bacterium]|jgi:aspartyl-tRNA(Asn)/glutamyl-tRNA(Gln) amidotransferase subunit B|nr:Asp-tRNA(Asn)/Glu-tRNA(Gln) amidotransferase subunit GatB [Candidatus Saccharimonadales bacterium]